MMLGSNRTGAGPRSPQPWRHLPTHPPFSVEQHLRRLLEEAVAPSLGVARAALWAPTRGSPADARARQVAMYLAHVGLGLNLSEVARLFARDRRTVAYACARVEDRRDCPPFDRALDVIEDTLRLVGLRQV